MRDNNSQIQTLCMCVWARWQFQKQVASSNTVCQTTAQSLSWHICLSMPLFCHLNNIFCRNSENYNALVSTPVRQCFFISLSLKHIWLAAAVSYYPVFKMPTEPTKKKKVFCVLVGVLFPHTDKGLCGLPTTWASGERRFYKSPKFFEENTKVLKRSPHLSLGDAIVFNIWHHKKRKRKGLASPVAMQFATLTDDGSDKRALTRMKDHRVFFSTSALHHSPRLLCMSGCLSVFLSFCAVCNPSKFLWQIVNMDQFGIFWYICKRIISSQSWAK